MSFTMVIHVCLAFPVTANKVMSIGMLAKVINSYFHFIHIFIAICCVICFAVQAGLYELELCTWNWRRGSLRKFKDGFDLNWGFAFFIVNFVGECVLAYMCWKRMHLNGAGGGGGGGGRGGGGGGGHYGGGYYGGGNPIDREDFHRKGGRY
eukprot:Sspe_Gene.54695::Locus_30157_Transcript_1_1_Confidence_1.000_Length_830::g.54695::m.54695